MKIIILTPIFLIVSLFFSMLGMGGGMFYVPILLLSQIPMRDASVLSLGVIMVTSLSALWVFWRNKLVDWRLAAVIDPPTDVMAFLSGYFSSIVPESVLMVVLTCTLVVAGTFMIRKRDSGTLCPARKTWWCWERNFHGRSYRVNLLLTIPIAAGVGVLSGMLGITGGVIKLPLMVLLCGVPMEIAVATSTIMIAVTALFALGGHVLAGRLSLTAMIPLATAAFIGGQLGSRFSIKSNKTVLRRVLGVVLIVIAAKLAFDLIFGKPV